MSFNPSKCSVLRSCPSRSSINSSYFIHNTTLQRSNTCKYLGVTISDDFKWSSHIAIITKKANQQLGFVWRNTRQLPRSFREAAYKSLVRPHLEYCSSVWDPYTTSDNQKLEKVQCGVGLLVMSQVIIKDVAVWLRWSKSWNGQAYRRGAQLAVSLWCTKSWMVSLQYPPRSFSTATPHAHVKITTWLFKHINQGATLINLLLFNDPSLNEINCRDL